MADVFKEGQPSDLDLSDLAGKICRQWKTLGLRLGISQDVLEEIDVNERNDRPYQMLLRWKRTTDSDTPYCDLYDALCNGRVGLNNLAKDFCYKKTPGVELTAAEPEETLSERADEKKNDHKVKQGTPSDEELEELGSEIHAERTSWKKLARRLKIEESKINGIDNKDEELSEKAYQMLLYWKQKHGSDAIYKVLFEALNHKMVNRIDLAKKYCCES